MEAPDLLLLVVRWVHGLSALAWVGGSLFYLLVLRPVLRRDGGHPPLEPALASAFRSLAETCALLLLLTGIVLTVARLTRPAVGPAYLVALGVKVALALWMMGLLWGHRRGPGPRRGPLRWLTHPTLFAVLGVAVFLLADLLQALFERGLANP